MSRSHHVPITVLLVDEPPSRWPGWVVPAGKGLAVGASVLAGACLLDLALHAEHQVLAFSGYCLYLLTTTVALARVLWPPNLKHE